MSAEAFGDDSIENGGRRDKRWQEKWKKGRYFVSRPRITSKEKCEQGGERLQSPGLDHKPSSAQFMRDSSVKE